MGEDNQELRINSKEKMVSHQESHIETRSIQFSKRKRHTDLQVQYPTSRNLIAN